MPQNYKYSVFNPKYYSIKLQISIILLIIINYSDSALAQVGSRVRDKKNKESKS